MNLSPEDHERVNAAIRGIEKLFKYLETTKGNQVKSVIGVDLEAATECLVDLVESARKADGQRQPGRVIPVENCIELYFHCVQCLRELPDGMAPREWARLNVGWSKQGFQVWCVRHDMNVLHMDFEDQKHPANTNRAVERGQA